jgi:hypothetical protein
MNLMRRILTRFGFLLPALLVALIAQSVAGQESAQPPSGQVVDASPERTTTAEGLSLSDRVIRDVLEPLRRGVETQNIQMILSIFDKKELNSYADLQGQLSAFFHQYDEVRFRYQIMQVTADAGHGSATADVQMDALPYEPTSVPARRSAQMRLQLKLVGKTWKVGGFSPSDFFSLGFQQPAR